MVTRVMVMLTYLIQYQIGQYGVGLAASQLTWVYGLERQHRQQMTHTNKEI